MLFIYLSGYLSGVIRAHFTNLLPTRPHDRFKNFHVPRAAAKTPRQAVANVGVSWVRYLFKQIHRRQNHARRADAALRAAAFDERLLHGVQLIAGCQGFDGFDISALDLGDRYQTTVNDLAINHHRARAALTFAA